MCVCVFQGQCFVDVQLYVLLHMHNNIIMLLISSEKLCVHTVMS